MNTSFIIIAKVLVETTFLFIRFLFQNVVKLFLLMLKPSFQDFNIIFSYLILGRIYKFDKK